MVNRDRESGSITGGRDTLYHCVITTPEYLFFLPTGYIFITFECNFTRWSIKCNNIRKPKEEFKRRERVAFKLKMIKRKKKRMVAEGDMMKFGRGGHIKYGRKSEKIS